MLKKGQRISSGAAWLLLLALFAKIHCLFFFISSLSFKDFFVRSFYPVTLSISRIKIGAEERSNRLVVQPGFLFWLRSRKPLALLFFLTSSLSFNDLFVRSVYLVTLSNSRIDIGAEERSKRLVVRPGLFVGFVRETLNPCLLLFSLLLPPKVVSFDRFIPSLSRTDSGVEESSKYVQWRSLTFCWLRSRKS